MAASIRQNIEVVQMKIAKAAERGRRPLDQILMVAVSKNQPVSVIQEAIQAGITDLGENRVQEAALKQQQIEAPVDWHLVAFANQQGSVRFRDLRSDSLGGPTSAPRSNSKKGRKKQSTS